MFYIYGHSEERPASSAHSKALNAASPEAARVVSHTGSLAQILHALSAQFIGPFVTLGSAGPNAWTTAFSTDFAGAPLPPIGYIGVTVGKSMKVQHGVFGASFSTEFAGFGQPSRAAVASLKFTSHFPTFSAASPTSVHLVKPASLPRAFAAASSSLTGLIFPRLGRSVIAAQQGAAAHALRQIAKSTAVQNGQPNAVFLLRALGRAPASIASTENAALSRTPGLPRRIIAASAPALLKGGGKLFLTSHPSQASALPRGTGRLLAAVSASAAAIARALPAHINALSPNVAHSTSGGGSLFARSFAVPSAEASLVQRGMTAQRGAVSPYVARALKGPGKPLSAPSAAVAALVRTTARLFSVVAGNAAALQRTPNVLRSVASPTVVALRTAGAHIGVVLTAGQAQAAALLRLLTHNTSFAIGLSQSSAVAISSVRAFLRGLVVGSAQAAGLTRGSTRTFLSTSPSAQAAARQTQRILSVLSAFVAAMRNLTPRSLILGVGSAASSVSLRAAHVRLVNVASAQATASARLHGATLSVLSAASLALFRAVSKTIPLLIPNLPVVTRMTVKTFVVQAASNISLIRSFLRIFSAASAEAAAIKPRFGSTVGTVASANAATLQRLTGKLAQAFAQQATASGRIDAISVHAGSPNVARSLQPKSNILRVAQAQVARVVTWFRIFIPDWAFQQISLLPPGGGPAEPPSFGPIDPQDQTLFAFDWSARADPNDPIISATVVSVPPGLIFAASPVFISGTLVTVTVAPFNPPQLPATYSLRCTAVFASGRRSSYSIPVPVRTL